MSFTNQSSFDVRCEWGAHGVTALRECRTFIIVDVLSFSTCVSVAAAKGVQVLPCRDNDHAANDIALRNNAILAGPRGSSYSLSPASLLHAPAGLVLALPSPNGATICLEAAQRGHVLAGCLRNAAAVAARARVLGGPFAIIPAGERWPDGTLRPSLEDLLGAGAIASGFPGTHAPEICGAVAAFEGASSRLSAVLFGCSSGRELVERGFTEDVRLAAQLNADNVAPELIDGRFMPLTG